MGATTAQLQLWFDAYSSLLPLYTIGKPLIGCYDFPAAVWPTTTQRWIWAGGFDIAGRWRFGTKSVCVVHPSREAIKQLLCARQQPT